MKKFLLFLLVIVFLIVGLVFGVYSWYQGEVNHSTEPHDKVTLEIKSGESLDAITDKLEAKKILNNKLVFKIYAKLNPEDMKKIKYGSFALLTGSSMPDIVKALSKAPATKGDLKITVKEGLRYDEVATTLDKGFDGAKEKKKFDKAEFTKIVEKPDDVKFSTDIQDFLDQYKPAGKNLEGFLFPDTYFFDFDAPSQEVVERLIGTLQSRISEQDYAKLKDSKYSLYQILIMSSILERESRLGEERAMIADIIYKRLEKGINGLKRLEFDATVLYPYKDWTASAYVLKYKDTTYNTFMHEGLTPTPICNPSISAIHAMINPIANDYYFYLHDNNGIIRYGKNYPEHLRNVDKYLLGK